MLFGKYCLCIDVGEKYVGMGVISLGWGWVGLSKRMNVVWVNDVGYCISLFEGMLKCE